MSTVKVVIADDEEDGRMLLKEYTKDLTDWDVVAVCTNGLEAVEAINNYEPDITFLDIQMPGLSGFQVVKQIIHVPQIIFSTAYDQFALKAFDLNAIDYLLKPYTKERFRQAVQKINLNDKSQSKKLKHFAQEIDDKRNFPEQILVEQGSKMVRIHTADILWIEARGDYSALHTAKQVYISSNGISAMQKKLHTDKFLRIHRSAIINIEQIKEVHKEPSGLQVVLSNGSIHKVSRSHTDGLKAFMV